MSTNELQSKAKELRELKRLREELDAEISAIEESLKTEMEAREATEIIAGEYKIRWTQVISSRLDSKALKVALPEIYARFVKETTSRRFSVA